MLFIDLQPTSGETVLPLLRCDICIVGSGPAGATLARELSHSGLSVVLLESGGEQRNPENDALNEIENVGRPRARDQWSVRNRVLGGASHTWGGRCGPFDAIDFEHREWVDHSGWPIALQELEPYLDRSAAHLGLALGSGYSDQRFWSIAERVAPKAEVDAKLLLPFFWQFSRDEAESYPFEYMRFGRHIRKHLGPNVTLVTGATVLRVLANDARTSIRGLEFATEDGRKHKLLATTVVLCAGGIENARILLNSGEPDRPALGNDRDQVGRYLMDHLRGPTAFFSVAGSAALRRRFGRYNVRGRFFRAGLRLSPAIQRRERLLNCAGWLGEVLAPDDPWDSLRRFAARKPSLPRDIFSVARNVPLLVHGAVDYFGSRNGLPRKLQDLTLDCMCEQMPDADSRVTLSQRRDRFGMRLPKVDWRSHPDEARTMHRMAELTAAELARIGFPRPVLADWVRDRAPIPQSFVDVAHPTATTRMSCDPKKGVLDVDCQVHGVAGLYVSGSSVFPTAGHCNPTQMIVAIAIRLADHLQNRRHRPLLVEMSHAG
ncbi:choline dehydrogenase [Rhizobium phaseoli]|uniref:GMC oxidoreductase n=1 Tax=Rhizobium phaseoli TaxID=396 RepID=UPI000366C97A|nr:GMC family oxidoreductase [Rhizobium phaseoli]KKZ84045.1 FAD dependent oxidoreductase [Rhizobium phaseoli Ch24-10]RDJ04983.1 choline dehydrogenase [Rhizobium phaseoli]RDJ07225.1 choline dehydrogenase [Rhizobium phaseoli]